MTPSTLMPSLSMAEILTWSLPGRALGILVKPEGPLIQGRPMILTDGMRIFTIFANMDPIFR